MKPITAQDRAAAIATLSRADVGTVLFVRAGGSEITDKRRDELLAKLAAHEYVELEIDLLAFEQKTGQRNRNCTRFRDESLRALGASGKSTPFLRDHAQRDLGARAGTIIRSKTEEPVDGHYQLKQTARVTAPWAVDALLRGNLDRFSIGWNPTGPILCSLHDEPVWSYWSGGKCLCWPGDTLKRVIGSDGVERLVYADDGELVAEWIYTKADLVETSAVSVPAVPSAQIEGIRASLAAARDGGDVTSVVVLSQDFLGDDTQRRRASAAELVSRGREPQKGDEMTTLKEALAAKLGIGATASDSEFITAVGTLEAKLEIAEQAKTKLEVEVAGHRKAERQTAEDKFIADAVKERRISDDENSVFGDETGVYRKLYAVNPTEAKTEIAKLAAGRIPPAEGLAIVNADKQRGKEHKGADQAAGAGAKSPRHKKFIAQMGMTEADHDAALAKGGN